LGDFPGGEQDKNYCPCGNRYFYLGFKLRRLGGAQSFRTHSSPIFSYWRFTAAQAMRKAASS
jgi:hypothetical protein